MYWICPSSCISRHQAECVYIKISSHLDLVDGHVMGPVWARCPCLCLRGSEYSFTTLTCQVKNPLCVVWQLIASVYFHSGISVILFRKQWLATEHKIEQKHWNYPHVANSSLSTIRCQPEIKPRNQKEKLELIALSYTNY